MYRISFRLKLILIFVAAVAIQGILIGFYSHQYACEIVMSNKKNEMADLVNRIDINVNDKVRYMTKQVENAVNSHMLQSYFDSRDTSVLHSVYFKEYLSQITSPFSAINNVILTDHEKILYDQNLAMQGEKIGARLQNTYQLAAEKKGQPVWLGIVGQMSKPQEKQVVAVASAIVNPATNEVDGVLVIELDPVNFSGMLLNNQNTFPNQYTFIIDKKWNILCSNKTINEQWVDHIAAEFDRGNRRFEANWQGKDYFICGQYNGVTGWETFSVIAKDNIFTQTSELMNLIMIFVMLCTFCVSLIIMAVSYTMTRPLLQLSGAMHKIQEGDFSLQIFTKRKDEIGRLIHSFNYMVKKINALIIEVYQEKIAQKNAEIESLQYQINPHFLYNTLDNINWMVIDRGAYEVSDTIIALGDLMKYSLDQNSRMVRLEQEIKYVISYLCIQKTRLEEKLQYHLDIAQSVKNCLVPKLILQPIVENAITHGIEPLKEGGLVCIRAKEENGMLSIEISDNGKGMDSEMLHRILHHLDSQKEGHTNIGVKNVDRRIRLHYGEEYGLKIKSAPNEGTTITIRIPKEEGRDSSENHDC